LENQIRLAPARPRTLAAVVKTQAITLGSAVTGLWASFTANIVAGGELTRFGVIPRTVDGLWGILFAPFIHANAAHLIANTVPLLVLGWLVLLRDARHFIPVTLLSMLGAGLCAWLLGAPNSVHIGASGVVFGYFGFLMLAGWFARSAASIAISLLVTVVWGGLVLGVLPGQPGISWQAHLGGFVGGVLAARWLAPRR
jgi:membrane associated rhomboid family serine protease